LAAFFAIILCFFFGFLEGFIGVINKDIKASSLIDFPL